MFSKLFLALAVSALAVNAQTIPPACVLACAGPAAIAAGCTSFADIPCVCGSAQFVADATACLTTYCSPEDLAAGMALQASQCTAASITPSGVVTTTNSLSVSLPSSSTSAPPGSTTVTSRTTASTTTTRATTAPTTTAPATTTPATTAPATTSATAAASGLVAQSGVGAIIGAVLAGVLAL